MAGTNVLAVGLGWDAVTAAVRLLAEAGADVAAFGIGAGSWFDDEVLPEEVREQVEAPLAAGSGRLAIIEHLDGAQLADLLADDGVAAVWEHATALLGDIHVALLGNWHGWTSYELIPGILERLGNRPVGEELIIEQSATPDHTTRWAHHWAAATSIPLAVIDPAADQPRCRRGGWRHS